MRKTLTPHDIANYIRMIRSQHSGAILVVEGDKDRRVFERFVDMACCKLVYAQGKTNAIDAIDILQNTNFVGVLAIIDTDFYKLDGIAPNTSNVILTDSHDLETMLIYSGALERVLLEFGSKLKLGRLKVAIRDFLLERAVPVGLLRWLSSPSKDNLSLTFKGISFKTFLEKKTLNLNIDKMIKEVISNSGNRQVDEILIRSKIVMLKDKGYDPWHICSGHDLIEILSLGLNDLFGNEKARKVSTVVVDSMLRIAFDYSHFSITQLYNLVKEWEQRNQPFKVLKT
jgi:hypothetical protein